MAQAPDYGQRTFMDDARVAYGRWAPLAVGTLVVLIGAFTVIACMLSWWALDAFVR